MLTTHPKKDIYLGILLATLAVVIWSGNFVIARGVSAQVGPFSLAFYRWATATCIMAPIAWKSFSSEKKLLYTHKKYLIWVALSGITLFNSFIYIAGHYTSAINLALVGTTSSPIFATVLALIFLKEKISAFRLVGIMVCLSGILLLLSGGKLETLLSFRFSKGDLWVLCGAMAFAVYNVLVRKKPLQISSLSFLFIIFFVGTIMLIPGFIIEQSAGMQTQWSWQLIGVILYLGAGTSVISFMSWNIAIQKLGTGRTVLFGNLTPIFSTLEAVWLLGERITHVHLISGLLVVSGLVLANTRRKPKRNSETLYE